jgi:predicted permease
LPFWIQVIAYYTLVFATGVGVWFFLSILFRRFRQRRHDEH